jgi:hypothetical protein
MISRRNARLHMPVVTKYSSRSALNRWLARVDDMRRIRTDEAAIVRIVYITSQGI